MSFFDDVNNVNIFGFIKNISNIPKLKRDLEEDATFGPVFDFFVATSESGGQVRVHCKEALDQSQIDAMNSVINNFVEQSVFDTLLNNLSVAQIEGWEIYRKIISLLNANGGLQGYLDDDQIPAVQVLMNIRNMLKDGFFEFSLRYYVNQIKPLSLLSQDEEDTVLGWIEDGARKFSADPATTESFIASYKLVPKGNYPFGAIGAP